MTTTGMSHWAQKANPDRWFESDLCAASARKLNVMLSALQCGHVITRTDMNTSQESIVLDDRRISEALAMKDSFRIQRLIDLYRASYDKDAFVATLMVRLMMEHDRRVLD